MVIFLMHSCKSEVKSDEIAQEEVTKQEEATISNIGTTLSIRAKQEVEGWLSFQMVQSKMNEYYSVTKSQALQNARELADLVKNTSDTIRVDKLDRPDILTRFNVLRNHALRLDDMSTIPNISDEDVMSEVEDLLNAYSSINEKINVIYKIEELENELEIDSENGTIIRSQSIPKKKEINKTLERRKRIITPKKASEKKKKGVIPLQKGKIKTTKKS